jgi:hypothetical protein
MITLPVLNQEICEGIVVWRSSGGERKDYREASGFGNIYVTVICI